MDINNSYQCSPLRINDCVTHPSQQQYIKIIFVKIIYICIYIDRNVRRLCACGRANNGHTCTWMVELSNAVNKSGKISVRISLCGDFSSIMCRFSSIVTVACIDLPD